MPCYTAGKNAEAVGEDFLPHVVYAFIPCLNIWCHATVRGKIREKKGIEVRTSVGGAWGVGAELGYVAVGKGVGGARG